MIIKCEKWQFGTNTLLRMSENDVAYVSCQGSAEVIQLRAVVSMFNKKKAPDGVRFCCNIEKDTSIINDICPDNMAKQIIVKVSI